MGGRKGNARGERKSGKGKGGRRRGINLPHGHLKTLAALVFSRWQNVDNDSADVTSAGRSFQIRGPTIRKVRLATVEVDNLTGDTIR